MRRVAVLAATLLGCQPAATSRDDAGLGASASPLASASPSIAESAPSPAASATRLARRIVKEGSLDDKTWVGAFDLELLPGGEGATFLGAITRCREEQRALCTESQWQRACAEDPSVARAATWTASGDEGRGFVVRGGGACGARLVAPPSETSPSRGVACCSRSIAVRALRIAPTAAAKKLLAFEAAVNEKRSNVLATLFEDRVNYYGKKGEPREALLRRFEGNWQAAPDLFALFDVCDASADSARDEWQGDCKRVVVSNGKLAYVVLRLVFGAESEKIRDVVEPTVFRRFAEP